MNTVYLKTNEIISLRVEGVNGVVIGIGVEDFMTASPREIVASEDTIDVIRFTPGDGDRVLGYLGNAEGGGLARL